MTVTGRTIMTMDSTWRCVERTTTRVLEPLLWYVGCVLSVHYANLFSLLAANRAYIYKSAERLCIPRRTLWRYTNVVLLLLLLLELRHCWMTDWVGPFYEAIAVLSVTHCCRRCRGHRCAGGVRQWRCATVATPGEWQCKTACSGKWAQHFSNASCLRFNVPLDTK